MTATKTNAQKLSTVGTQGASETWAVAHRQAATCPRPGFERALAALFTGWLGYAETHQAEYDSGIGDDGVLGEHWAQIGAGLRGLLNGSLGRFDGGTLDALLADTLRQQGFDPDRL
jgi:hypothetical protein